MLTRLAILPLVLAFSFPTCKKNGNLMVNAQPQKATPAAAATVNSSPSAPPTNPTASAPKSAKPVVDQNAQTIILGYHGIVNNVRHPDTQITPQEFEKQMQELKNRGITVIGMQDLLAWKRGEKSIPPRCAVITLDDGLKSQYEVGWPILKKFGYPFTMFIYTEGIQGGHFGGGQAMTWEMLDEMRDAGIDIEAHSKTHQDLRKPYDKVTKRKLSPPEYEQWLQDEIAGSKQVLEQKLGIKVNCFAVPYGFYNEQAKQIAKNAGYEAVFTTYGQPITFRSPSDSLGRTFIWGNKPKIFADAIASIATSGGGPGAPPVAEVATTNLSTQPADGETVRTALPLIRANLSGIGQIDPNSVQLRVSGLGLVPASFDSKTGVVAYQVTQKLRDKSCTVILSAKSGGKKVEAHWTFGIEESAAATSTPTPTPTPKK
jgi:peptidoglycan/xylan/chitin deacetylase (PgdA/CDA1 family)